MAAQLSYGRSFERALREPTPKKRKLSFGRLLFVALLAAVLAIVLSEDLRKALLDRMFGAEEEFEYTSTTAPVAPAADTA